MVEKREGDAVSSITVERTGFGIVVAAEGDDEAEALLDGLPPLKAARYLVATPALQQSLREAAPEIVDAVRPHLDGTVVVPAEGFAGDGEDGVEAASARLARVLGVAVVAPEGRFLPCSGALFSVGRGDGWIARSPQGARVPAGRRYPAPAWQQHLPQNLAGTAHIPAGLWVTAGAQARHAVRLAGVAVRDGQLLVVVGSPAEPAPSRERLSTVLQALPAEVRSAVALVGYGPGSLPLDTVRGLAATLGQPLRIAHGVEIDGSSVRLDGDEETLPPTLAVESVCAPDGSVSLERWVTPPGLVPAPAGGYRFDERSRARRRASEEWQVHIGPTGLTVAPVGATLVDPDAVPSAGDALGVFLQCDGARRPAGLSRLLAPLLARLERLGPVTIHPLDATARRVVRNGYPGRWAPTEALALTPDGRLVAATMDATGDTRGVDGPLVVDDVESGAVAVGEADAVGTAEADGAGTAEADAVGAAETDAVGTAETDAVDDGETDAVAPPSDRSGLPLDGRGRPDAPATSAGVPPTGPDPRFSEGPFTVDAVVGAEAERRPPRESAVGRRARAALVTNAAGGEQAAAGRATPAPSAPPTPAAAPAPVAEQPREPAPVAAPAPGTGAPRAGLTRALQGSTLTPAPGVTVRPVPAPDPAPQRQTALQGAPFAGVRLPASTPAESTTAPAPESALAPEIAPERGTALAPESALASEHAPAAPESALAPESAPAAPASALLLPRRLQEVPVGIRSTAEQRHRVRTALGPRYDVASRTVSQLLAQQPGMRASAGDRSAMLTGLSLVRVFATDPHADYDLDFHVCLAEGLAMLPTARTVVVRGIPALVEVAPGDTLRLRMPVVAAAADGPATGPSEALIWTTSGRRLDRVLHGVTGAADIALPAGLRLRVLEGGPAARVLLAEEGAGTEQALARLRAAAEARGDLRAHTDDRWLGDLPAAA